MRPWMQQTTSPSRPRKQPAGGAHVGDALRMRRAALAFLLWAMQEADIEVSHCLESIPIHPLSVICKHRTWSAAPCKVTCKSLRSQGPHQGSTKLPLGGANAQLADMAARSTRCGCQQKQSCPDQAWRLEQATLHCKCAQWGPGKVGSTCLHCRPQNTHSAFG